MRYLLLISIALIAGCDMPACRNTNPVFDKYPVTAPEYTKELAERIKKAGKDKFSYSIGDYTIVDGEEYMTVNVRGDSVCAKAMMRITGSKRLNDYRRVKGQSYVWAGLSGLKYDMIEDKGGYQFIFRDVAHIID